MRIQEDIILWGPSGSGKTSLLRAFIKRLNRLSAQDEDFFFNAINWQTGLPFPTTSFEERPEGTQYEADELVIIERKPKKKSPVHENSCAFEYRIHIKDLAGGRAIQSAQDDQVSLNGNNIIISLDATSNTSTHNYPAKKYATDLLNLYNRLYRMEKRLSNMRIVVCVTKTFGSGIRFMVNPAGEIEVHNGLLQELAAHFKGSGVIVELKRLETSAAGFQIFLTSATGFYTKDGDRWENYYHGIGDSKKWLASEEEWDPIGVTDPFFWMFNENETRYFAKRSAFLPWPIFNPR